MGDLFGMADFLDASHNCGRINLPTVSHSWSNELSKADKGYRQAYFFTFPTDSCHTIFVGCN